MRKLIFILAFCFIAIGSAAQGIKFTASAPKVVGLNQRFEVSFRINTANVSNFKSPTFRGMQILSGPHQSQSTSMININGRQQGGTYITFSYYLQPIALGTINIPPAKITAEGKEYYSNQLTIQVEKNATAQSTYGNNRQQNQQYGSQYGQSAPTIELDDQALFLRAITDKTSVVEGEQIVLTYKLYTLLGISQYQIERSPLSKGFWLEELDSQQQPQMSQEIYDGRRYNVATIRKVLVYPQQSGRLTIEPFSIEVTAHVKTKDKRKQSTGDPFFDSFFNDPFFSSMFDIADQPVQKKISSNSVSINVKQLRNQPQNYIGAVGKFNISSEIDKTSYAENEAINLKYTISGSGNLTLIDQLPIKLPSDFDIYEPTITDDIKKDENGITGKRTFEYVVIPRQEGRFSIPPLTVSYYDTETKDFKTLSTDNYNLTITKSKDSESASNLRNEREKYRKMPIKPLKNIKVLHNFTLNSYNNVWFWLIAAIILALTTAFICIYRQILENNKDIKAVKLRKANKIAQKRLKTAFKYLQNGENEAFIDETSRSIWTYIENRFSIDRFNLTKDTIFSVLNSYKIDDSLINDLQALLEKCEIIRFSPEKSVEQNEIIYHQSITLITSLETALKSRQKGEIFHEND
ncbi:MAG: BatD family protein [Bacteroidales bacterium]|nr:BatD family protein [Bacteroidales bacterium]